MSWVGEGEWGRKRVKKNGHAERSTAKSKHLYRNTKHDYFGGRNASTSGRRMSMMLR
jgi:hypothetical protein